MQPKQQQLIDAVTARFGRKAVTTDPNVIAPWLVDWRKRFAGTAPAMLSPDSVEAVRFIVDHARTAAIPLVPQGGNTSMVGGATPSSDGHALLLSLRRLDHIRMIDPRANLVVAEAGVILATLHDAAARADRRFPLTLGARGTATIGGLVSTNAGGTQVLRWGTMRRLVAGVEAVLPDGSLHDGLAALKKDNRGYDLDQLLIGAEGTLGIITAATLRLAPAVIDRAVAWAGVADPAMALALLRRLEATTDAIESFEIVPAEMLATVEAHLPGARAPLAAPSAWNVLIEAVRTSADAEPPEALLTRLLGVSGDLVEDAVLAVNETQAEAFWRLRDAISEAERAIGPAVQHDISVPVDLMPRFLIDGADQIQRRFPGVHASGFGHLGDGNVHFHVRAPDEIEPASWYAGQALAISRFVHDLVTQMGGSISAEHGIGQMKLTELERLAPPARLYALRAIKAAIDPIGLMNPGKLVNPGQMVNPDKPVALAPTDSGS